MKKIISLLLTMSLLLCMDSSVIATEDGGDQSETSVSDSFDTVLTSSSSEEEEQSVEQQISDSVGEPEMSETTESSEVSQKPESTEANDGMEPASNGELSMENEIPGDSPVPMSGETYDLTISWSGMDFTYKPATQGEWNPESLSYGESDGKPTWTSSNGSDYGTFTVKCNDTNSDITVMFKFTKNTAFTPTAKMKFSTDTGFSRPQKDTCYLEFGSDDTGTSQSLYVQPEVNTKTTTAESFEAAGNKLGDITITVEVTEMGNPTRPSGPEIFD